MNKTTKEYELAMSYRDLLLRINDDILSSLNTAIDLDLPRSRVSKRICELLEHNRAVLKLIDKDAID